MPSVPQLQAAAVAGPGGDQRNSREQIRRFSFRTHDLWAYVAPDTQVTIRVDGDPLPILGHGMYVKPGIQGEHGLEELEQLFRQGHVLTHKGEIALSKKHDVEWQEAVIALYDRVRTVVSQEYGYDVFFAYGTLLGAVREGGYIGHDVDFDAAYISKHRTGQEAAAELADLALLLVEGGLDVDCRIFALHISDPKDPANRIDLFHTFFGHGGLLRFPFGVAGTSTFAESQWLGTTEIDFPGGRGLIPHAAEELVAHLYGEDWQQPKPGFNWKLDRTDSAKSGALSPTLRTKAYWANFYAHNTYTTGSTFCEYINNRTDTPHTIIDIGCGDGRDSVTFAQNGRHTLGLDQSPTGIQNATAHATQLNLTNCTFGVCDVANTHDLRRALDTITHTTDTTREPLMFYLRFFLHAINEETQTGLLTAINTHAQPGDYFAAEFRTDKDKTAHHVHTKHYRRFQNAAAFHTTLTNLGFEILHEQETNGLSPYQNEDPILYRIIARR